jgi:hypothetical protein
MLLVVHLLMRGGLGVLAGKTQDYINNYDKKGTGYFFSSIHCCFKWTVISISSPALLAQGSFQVLKSRR